jgi:hypothetical protein
LLFLENRALHIWSVEQPAHLCPRRCAGGPGMEQAGPSAQGPRTINQHSQHVVNLPVLTAAALLSAPRLRIPLILRRAPLIPAPPSSPNLPPRISLRPPKTLASSPLSSIRRSSMRCSPPASSSDSLSLPRPCTIESPPLLPLPPRAAPCERQGSAVGHVPSATTQGGRRAGWPVLPSCSAPVSNPCCSDRILPSVLCAFFYI